MSKDRLEGFIDNNREAFDSEIPSLNIFADIEKELNSEPKKNTRKLATRSAAAIVVLAIVCAWFLMANDNSNKQMKMNESPLPMMAELSHSELAEASEFFTQKINNNRGKLAALGHHDPDVYRDLRHMESMYDTLRMEWARNPHKSDERLINAMIDNYRHRSMLLENVVNRVEGRGNEYSFISARPAVYKR